MLKSAFLSMAMALSSVQALACDGLRDGPDGVVAQVSDGDTLVLDSGLFVRLIGVQAPRLPKGREDFAPWPLAEAAREALEAMVLGRPVHLAYGGAERDRYGRALAQVFLVDGDERVWLQDALVSRGLARVYSFRDNRACLDQLLSAEASARANRLGIWADPYYSIRAADQPARLLAGHYELVEGRVLSAEEAGGRIYLNFGRYWKEDFTAVIEGKAKALFAEEGIDLLALQGALVRIRGWVDDKDGPRIGVTHPEQIEVLAIR